MLDSGGDGVAALAYTSAGRILAFTCTPTITPTAESQGANIKLFDLAAQKELAVLSGHTRTIFALAISRDDKTLVSGASDKTVRLWDLGTRRQRAVLEGHKRPVWTVAIST
jgi:WD40 repeat protein